MKGKGHLEVRHSSKTFHQGTIHEVMALNDIHFTVEPGSFVVILGTNGSGKSTLLNAIAGSFLLNAGQIFLGGKEITRWSEHRRAGLIGRVFQNPFQGTASHMTLEENVVLASRRGKYRGLGWAVSSAMKKEIRERVASLKMGLEARLQQPMGNFSGGQRQALTLLMASWLPPDLLLLDEHIAALDPKSADQVIRLTEAFIQQGKGTTLMVTHSMQQAVNLGDRILMMHQGKIIHDFQGAEKKRLRIEDLLARFEEIRRRDQLEETAAHLLETAYI